MSDKPKCDPTCYTNGKGCTQSTNGQCKILYDDGKISQPYQSNKTYHKNTKTTTPLPPPVQDFSGLYYKGAPVHFDRIQELLEKRIQEAEKTFAETFHYLPDFRYKNVKIYYDPIDEWPCIDVESEPED